MKSFWQLWPKSTNSDTQKRQAERALQQVIRRERHVKGVSINSAGTIEDKAVQILLFQINSFSCICAGLMPGSGSQRIMQWNADVCGWHSPCVLTKASSIRLPDRPRADQLGKGPLNTPLSDCNSNLGMHTFRCCLRRFYNFFIYFYLF